jgi:hypothetical protein
LILADASALVLDVRAVVAVLSPQLREAGSRGLSAYRKNHSQIAPTEQQEARGKSAVALYPLADGVGIGFQYHL